jgi:hypothetical protein
MLYVHTYEQLSNHHLKYEKTVQPLNYYRPVFKAKLAPTEKFAPTRKFCNVGANPRLGANRAKSNTGVAAIFAPTRRLFCRRDNLFKKLPSDDRKMRILCDENQAMFCYLNRHRKAFCISPKSDG